MINRREVLKAATGLTVGGAMSVVASATPAFGAPQDLRPGERYVDVPGGRVWVNVVGSGWRPPLLVLHGGPGAGHDYLEPLGEFATSRAVVFYDQLGCGRSDKPDNPSLWTIDRFVAEVHAVRRALKLNRHHLYGHSWGGWLAIEYLLRRSPRGVGAVVLSSTSASAAQFVAGTRYLRTLLPADVQQVLDHYEAKGDFTAPEYLDAVNVFYRNFLCRLDPYPEPLLRSAANLAGNQVYATMGGPNELSVTGNLASWHRTSQVSCIQNPVLLTRGRYDEFAEPCTDTLQRLLPRAERVEFPHSAHVAMWEDQQAYLHALTSFLTAWDPIVGWYT
ncbi:proline iminopeptidase-family hydrolase [Kutzneria kofuensis]|uniref:Proline iminopeptidase n=1 Tax=Kutzneria kofuensis TaxID=103725 RepID=A0A7W9KQB4_9PSEU|nr:proline iminopeptidase-family hydrolase [Kutzneria kofuensis]MBB5896665.1 proline-specific peptidase [Kutzneria kofuensis]